MKIAVIGLGFVGLTTALGFADKGFDVHGYDVNEERTAMIGGKRLPFLEPGLDLALERTIGSHFFIASEASKAVENAVCIFFCVGTPCTAEGTADLSHMFAAIDSVVAIADPECVFIVKSTVPPGTTDGRILPYARSKGFTGSVTANPEFLREGYCWEDFIAPDRIICGCGEKDERAVALFQNLYSAFQAPTHFVSPTTAEFIKYLSNSLLASLISFSNEMALIADATGGINIAKAFKILHEDKRLASTGICHYIYPGCGYGGYCLPKDTTALAAHARASGVVPHILETVIALNHEMPALAARKIGHLAGFHEAKIGILGLSFKPNSSDVRDTPAAKIIAHLLHNGYKSIYAYDPVATTEFREQYKLDITYMDSKEDVYDTCDTIAIVTPWAEFRDAGHLHPNKKICDCRYSLGV